MKPRRIVPLKKISRLKIGVAACCALCAGICVPAAAETEWKLVFEDDFDGSSLDSSKWTRIDCPSWSNSDWRKYMDAESGDLVAFEDGSIVLKGTKNSADASTRDYREAGIYTLNKFSFQYGKVEVRAKFDNIQGVWPAIWMMHQSGSWPDAGEIDIMEHLNYQGNVYQTLHVANSSGKDSSVGVTPGIDKTDFNTYGVEWSPGEISFLLNGEVTATYTADDVNGRWPFDDENNGFYLILSMQIGGSWVENAGLNKGIDASTLYNSGANMWIDYVRVWQDASMIPEPSAFALLAGTCAAAATVSARRRGSAGKRRSRSR